MELRSVLAAIARNAVVIIVTVVAALAVAGGLSVVISPNYQTETKVLLQGNVTGGSVTNAAQVTTLLTATAPTYAALAQTPAVLDPAIKQSGVDVASTDLVDDVSATLEPQTAIVTITVNAGSAEDVAKLANAISASLITQIESKSVIGDVGLTGVVVESPEIPSSPESPNLVVNLLIGLAVGLVVSFVVVVVREALSADAPRAA